MVETLRSLEMEREVGGRLGEGELAVLAKEEEGEDMAWRSSIEFEGHAEAGAKIIFKTSLNTYHL